MGSVVALHALFVFALITAIGPLPARVSEVSLVLTGGQPGEPTSETKPLDMVMPDANDIAPPAIDVDPSTAITRSAPVSRGSPNVTRPAMALAEAHAFPPLPAGYAAGSKAVVRLVITIARDGAIAGAEIAKSCGSDALDRLALEWVKAHWRYQPALENGVAIAATTSAIVVFTPAA